MDKTFKSLQGENSDKTVRYDNKGQPIGYERLLDLTYYFKEEGDFDHLILTFPERLHDVLCVDVMKKVVSLMNEMIRKSED